jgi:hypothetical protein
MDDGCEHGVWQMSDIIFYGGGPFKMGRLSTMLSYIRKERGLEILHDDENI